MEFTFIDAANDLCCHPFDSLEEAHGKIGSGPVIIDGRVGRLQFVDVDSTASTFVDDGDSILQFFAYKHLSEHLQVVSKHFGRLAQRMVLTLPKNEERDVMLRKLLEGKDAGVRALLSK